MELTRYDSPSMYDVDAFEAAANTYQYESFRAKLFENAIAPYNTNTVIAKDFITFVHESSDIKYVSQQTFTRDWLAKHGATEIPEKYQSAFDTLFSMIDAKPAESDPDKLYVKLEFGKRKYEFKRYVDDITNDPSKTYEQNPFTWSTEFLDSVSKGLTAAFENLHKKSGAMKDTKQLSEDYRETLEKRRVLETPSWHNPILDALIPEGPLPKNGGMIVASSGMGKSAFVLDEVDRLIDADVPVMSFSLEMGEETTMDRLMSKRTRIPYKDIVKSTLNDDQRYKLIKEAVEKELKRLEVHDMFRLSDSPSWTLDEIEAEVKSFQQTLPSEDKYCIVFIDLISMVEDFCKTENGLNLAQSMELAINKMNSIAKRLGIHWVGVAQLNRTVEADKVTSLATIEKLRPSRAAVKNSNALLERSRYVIALFRKKYFATMYLAPEEADLVEDIVDISLLKASNGDVGAKHMKFNGPTFTLTPVEEEALSL